MKIVKKFLGGLILMSVGLSAQAGHLFTQALLNTPIDLSAGLGITIPQEALESNGSQWDIYLCDFDSGDSMRLTIGSVTLDLDFDSLPAGWSYSPATCPSTGTLGTSTSPPGFNTLNPSVPFNWRFDATGGSFTLLGYRLNIVPGRIDGTGSGTVNQSAVTASRGAPIPVFGPIHMVLLALALVGIAGIKQRRLFSR